MEIAGMIRDMIVFYKGNPHDVNHFLKVYAYARTIGGLSGLDAETQRILEIASVVHDIACPLCREKYGRADGYLQEKESEELLRRFLSRYGLPDSVLERVIFLVCHHHTVAGVDGMDWRILLEADFLVNAEENRMSQAQMDSAKEAFFRTDAGIELLALMATGMNKDGSVRK